MHHLVVTRVSLLPELATKKQETPINKRSPKSAKRQKDFKSLYQYLNVQPFPSLPPAQQ